MKSPSVIVLGLYLPGIDILRNFRSRAIPCMGMDCSDNSPGFGLRKVPVLLCPDPEKEEQAWLAFMLGYAGKSDQKPALLITSDKFILPVLRNAAILDPYFLFQIFLVFFKFLQISYFFIQIGQQGGRFLYLIF